MCGFLHSNILNTVNTIEYLVEKVLLRSAVPFFFVVSGFFLAKKLLHDPSKTTLKRYLLRLIFPLVVFETVNCCLKFIEFIINGTSARAALPVIFQSIIV